MKPIKEHSVGQRQRSSYLTHWIKSPSSSLENTQKMQGNGAALSKLWSAVIHTETE